MTEASSTTFPQPRVAASVAAAFEHMMDDARVLAPALADHLAGWVSQVLGEPGVAVFTLPRSYPLVHLPMWAAPELPQAILDDITLSSLYGYLYVRLIDNAADADTQNHDPRLLHLGALLHTGFQLPYQKHFPFGHPFWEIFRRAWIGAAEASIVDSHTPAPGLDDFEKFSARKTTSAIGPVAAALYATGGEDRFPAWEDLIGSFGRWHQLDNDFVGWRKDLHYGNPNLLVAEARRAGVEEDRMIEWFLAEGFAWGAGLLDRYAQAVTDQATKVDSPGLKSYLSSRFSEHRARQEELQQSVAKVDRVLRSLTDANEGV